MAMAVFAGLGYPALTGAWSAQLPKMIPVDRLKHAYASDAATYSVAAVVAPPLATALVARLGDRAAVGARHPAGRLRRAAADRPAPRAR